VDLGYSFLIPPALLWRFRATRFIAETGAAVRITVPGDEGVVCAAAQ
jgi:hypothetical protein